MTISPRWKERLADLLQDLSRQFAHFPWKTTLLTLYERFREDRLGLTASSLTFTTSIALVPFFTVALALFTAFPIFAKVQVTLQDWLIQSLIPDNIARQVLGYLTQFAGKASKLGAAGLAILLVTALALILTIDKTLNSIWRVRKQRPLPQRVLIYWAAITLGPLVMGGSLAITSYAISASRGVVGVLPGGVRFLLDVAEFTLLAGGLAALYRYVPNTHVKWGHAWAGGVFVSTGIELAKKLLGLYISSVPTYSAVYGTFATLPILLVWIYLAWVIVLLGAVVTAYLPILLTGVVRRGNGNGWQFQLAVEVLQQLHAARTRPGRGLNLTQLVQVLQVDALQLEPVLETLTALDWVQQLNEANATDDARYVLLAEPETTLLAPLAERLLMQPATSVQKIWRNSRMPALFLKDAL